MTLERTMQAIGSAAKQGSKHLQLATADMRTKAIWAMARAIRQQAGAILDANAQDLAHATALTDRLLFDEERLEAIAESLETVADLPDPLGKDVARWVRPNGLEIARVSVPIGVIGMIYESRPNVTADAAAIGIRSGNAIVLRPGSEALRSARAIHQAIVSGLEHAGLPPECVQLVPTSDRRAVDMLLEGLSGTIDLIIPRGGVGLVDKVRREARVPVLAQSGGVCHTYLHWSADPAMAASVVRNAKLRRVSICGATETLLIDRDAASVLLPAVAKALEKCELRGDEEARAILPMEAADEDDWKAEYLAPILSVKLVSGMDEAIAHIERYGTGHTEAIIAEDAVAAEQFLTRVDSAIVMWNASTQFADGGEFGFGAEIGIATGRFHARGPVGPDQLTTYKYQVRGTGQIRP